MSLVIIASVGGKKKVGQRGVEGGTVLSRNATGLLDKDRLSRTKTSRNFEGLGQKILKVNSF